MKTEEEKYLEYIERISLITFSLLLNMVMIGFFIKAQLKIGTGKATIINFSLNFIFTVI